MIHIRAQKPTAIVEDFVQLTIDVEVDLALEMCLKDLALELGLSPFTTVRQFRAANGMTPYAYLLEMRLARAKKMLMQTSISIARIAEATGFENVAHFAHFFRSKTGASATSFRSTSQR